MREFTLTEVVKKLIGEVLPRGEAFGDVVRLENLKEMCAVTEALLLRIRLVAEGGNKADDMQRAGKYASDYLDYFHDITEFNRETFTSHSIE